MEQSQAEAPAEPAPGADGTAPTEEPTEEAKVAVEPKAKPRTRRRTKAANGPKSASDTKGTEEATPDDESAKSADDAEAKPASA